MQVARVHSIRHQQKRPRRTQNKRGVSRDTPLFDMERETRLELATYSLEGYRSTN